ncbi:MAG: deoxyribodipyrimidine photo-lyase [Bacteroidota bacterium]
MTTLVWFRADLRLADNPALSYAVEHSETVIPVFIWDAEAERDVSQRDAVSGAHLVWLYHALQSLDADLRQKGSRLILRRGDMLDQLNKLVQELGANAVVWNARVVPGFRHRDQDVADALRGDGVAVHTFDGRLLHDPNQIQTGSGGPYRVFTPFWRKFCKQIEVDAPVGTPRMGTTKAPASWPDSDDIATWGFTAHTQDGTDWASGLREGWAMSEAGAHDRLDAFIEDALLDYEDDRNRPDRVGSSMLSPYLHHGHLSPRQVWHRVDGWVQNGAMREAADAYLREIVWREFSYHVLHHYPDTPAEPLKDKYAAFPWEEDAEGLHRWQHGQTGFPIVDAGMRQLWATGWMHNRVRMIVASFLTKDLLIPWQDGAAWFWDTLVDADLANNTMGWQWAAGCGADAQPFFRIFNPISQGERYDPHGAYVKQWIPELAGLPKKYIHAPWNAPRGVLQNAGVELGVDYPLPIVDHSEARQRALDALDAMKQAA